MGGNDVESSAVEILEEKSKYIILSRVHEHLPRHQEFVNGRDPIHFHQVASHRLKERKRVPSLTPY